MIEYILARLLMMSIAGSAATLILLLARPLTSKLFSAKWHYYTYIAVLLVFLLPFSCSLKQKADVSYESDTNTAKEVIVLYVNNGHTDMKANANASEQPDTHTFEIPTDIPDFVLYLWIFGAILFLLFSVFSYLVHFARVKKSSTPYITEAAEYPGLHIYKSSAVSSPVLFGFIKGRLYLPEREFSDTELESILRHEYVHFRRCDVGIKWLCLFAKAVLPFNPFVHLLSESISVWCEISCDESATKGLDKNGMRLYCETILSLISENRKEYRHALGVSGTKRNLERRFKAIMKEKRFSKKTVFISAIIASFVLLSAITVSAILGGRVEKDADTPKNNDISVEDNSSAALPDGRNKAFETLYYYNGDESDTEISEEEPVVKYYVVDKDSEKESNSPEIIIDKYESDSPEIIIDNNAVEYRLIPDSENTSGAAQISAPYDVEKHSGVDYKLEAGTEIGSPIEGTVEVAEYESEKGNHVIITGYDGETKVVFAHLEKMYVAAGDKVNVGDILGTVGNTGKSTGPHLHIEYYENGEAQNPVNIVFVEKDGKISALYSEPELIANE